MKRRSFFSWLAAPLVLPWLSKLKTKVVRINAEPKPEIEQYTCKIEIGDSWVSDVEYHRQALYDLNRLIEQWNHGVIS